MPITKEELCEYYLSDSQKERLKSNVTPKEWKDDLIELCKQKFQFAMAVHMITTMALSMTKDTKEAKKIYDVLTSLSGEEVIKEIKEGIKPCPTLVM